MNLNPPRSAYDIFLWPCGTWCYRNEVADYDWLSDDYQVVHLRSSRWYELLRQRNYWEAC